MRALVVFFFPILSSVAENINCTSDPIQLSAGDEFIFDIHAVGFNLFCVYQIIPDLYVIPYINYTSHLFGTNDHVYITSDPTPFTQGRSSRIPDWDPSQMGPPLSDFSDQLSWIPAPFNVSFDVSNSTLVYGSFVLLIHGIDYTPRRIKEFVVSPDGDGTIVDSESFEEESSAVRFTAIGENFFCPDDHLELRVINYPEFLWTNNSQDTFYIMENDKFLCSSMDLLQQGPNASMFSEGRSLTIFSRTPDSRQGITFLATTPYTFEGEVSVRSLWESDGPTELDATLQPQIVHFVAPAGRNTTRYTTHFTFLGNGNLTIYAGAVTKDRQDLLLAEIRTEDASLALPLEIKGRTRTLIFTEGKVLMDISLTQPDGFGLVKSGQLGVIMSNNYPFTSGVKETGSYSLKGADDEAFMFYLEVYGIGLSEEDFIWIELKEGEKVKQTNFTKPVETKLNGKGQICTLNYTIGAQSKGFLVRYEVKRVESKSSGRRSLLFLLPMLFFTL